MVRYAQKLVPILQGELDVLAYNPAIWINPTDIDAPKTGTVHTLANLGSYVDFVPSNALNAAEAGATINGVSVYDYDKTDNYRPEDSSRSPWGGLNSQITEAEIFFVFQIQTNESGYLMITGGNANDGTRFLIHAPWSNGHVYFYDGDMNAVSSGKLNIGQPYIITCVTSATEGIKLVRVNGRTTSQKTGGGQGKVGGTLKIMVSTLALGKTI